VCVACQLELCSGWMCVWPVSCSRVVDGCVCGTQLSDDVKQLELVQVSEQLAAVQHELALTQQVLLTVLCVL